MKQIVFVGLPKVGKSKLIKLIVNDKSQSIDTRDWHKYTYLSDDKSVDLIDTPGFIQKPSDKFEIKAMDALDSAINNADAIYHVFDADTGLTYEDLFLDKKIYSLGKKISHISIGKSREKTDIIVSKLHHKDLKDIKSDISNYLTLSEKDPTLKLAIVGRPNVGKSTLLNKIIGQERAIVTNIPGTTLSSIDVSFTVNDTNLKLIDTAGIRKMSKTSENEASAIRETYKNIRHADIVFLLLDADAGLVTQDKKLIQEALKLGKALIIVLNKIDLIPAVKRSSIATYITQSMPDMKFLPVVSASAQTGFNIRKLILQGINLFKQAHTKLTTSSLTKILHLAIENNPPPLFQRRPVRLRLAHVGSKDPYIIIIHGNRVSALSKSYQRYIHNFFHNSLKLGIIFKLNFKDKD
jgi:GTP-binding protein